MTYQPPSPEALANLRARYAAIGDFARSGYRDMEAYNRCVQVHRAQGHTTLLYMFERESLVADPGNMVIVETAA